MAYDKDTVRKLLEQAKAAGSSALMAPEAKTLWTSTRTICSSSSGRATKQIRDEDDADAIEASH